MKIFIGLITPDQALRSFFGQGKNAVVPKDAARRGFWADNFDSAVTASYSPKNGNSAANLEQFLLSETAKADVCLLLVDRRWQYLLNNSANATFIVPFDHSKIGNSVLNFFQKILANALRSSAHLGMWFSKGREKSLLGLPIRNFYSAELQEIARLCRDDNLQKDFQNKIDGELAGLRSRIRPRKRSDFKKLYAVDDRRRFFEHGFEKHSRFETGEPHTSACELAGHFRFGFRIDAERHYNVSETEGDTTSINGQFYDCHGQERHEDNRTHLNMFANDFY